MKMVYLETDCVICGKSFVRPVKTTSYLTSTTVAHPGAKYCSRTCMNNRKSFGHNTPVTRLVYSISGSQTVP